MRTTQDMLSQKKKTQPPQGEKMRNPTFIKRKITISIKKDLKGATT